MENNKGKHQRSLLHNSETHGLQYHSPFRECLCCAVSISLHGSTVWRTSTLQSCSRPAKADCAHVLTALCSNLRPKVYSWDEYISKIENCYIYQLFKTFTLPRFTCSSSTLYSCLLSVVFICFILLFSLWKSCFSHEIVVPGSHGLPQIILAFQSVLYKHEFWCTKCIHLVRGMGEGILVCALLQSGSPWGMPHWEQA